MIFTKIAERVRILKVVRCDKNHYYDTDQYSFCPMCQKNKGQLESEEIQLTIREILDDDLQFQSQSPENSNNPEVLHTIPDNDFSENSENYGRNIIEIQKIQEDNVESEKTVAFYNLSGTEPVTGWLVCIHGCYFGESFPLKTGQNFIGRAMNMDVSLRDDKTISRQCHAMIAFDPECSEFFLSPGHSNGLTYLNQKLLLHPEKLSNYDEIQIGESQFIFIQFCNPEHNWKKYLN